jgi:AraC-like DNA-binding protein
MLLALKEPRRTLEDTRRIIALGASDPKVVDAIERLLDLFRSPRDIQILGPAILREIHFRMLTGAHGDATRAALGHNGRVAKIGRALRRIENEFNTRLSAEALAEEACMCLTSFHENFRAVTGSTPLQYLKSLRLNTARVLMVRDGINAAAASGRVGYESPSQFSREFKRQFGKTPAQFARDSTALGFHGYSEAIPERHVGPKRPDRLTHRPNASQSSAAHSHDSQLEKHVLASGPLMHAAIPSAELRAGIPDRMSCLQSSTHRGL